MHSNKIGAFYFFFFFLFFFIILCFTPLISADGSKLSTNFYDTSCRNLQGIVNDLVVNASDSNPRMPASLLRLHFHDCFVLGCDASLLLDGKQGEQFAFPNRNSILGLDVVNKIKEKVEKHCPGIVSCADILALAARDAVKISLKKGWEVPLGRLDGMNSNQSGANSEIPSPFDPLRILIKKFETKGLSIQDMVALSGGHTIGMAKCSSFKNRLYFRNSTANVNAKLLKDLRGICKNDSSTDNVTVPLDKRSPIDFDNKFYEIIRNKEAVLESDQTLGSDSKTVRWVNKYSTHLNDFLKDFGEAMLRMGKIGVLTKGENGEIRKKCGSTNKL